MCNNWSRKPCSSRRPEREVHAQLRTEAQAALLVLLALGARTAPMPPSGGYRRWRGMPPTAAMRRWRRVSCLASTSRASRSTLARPGWIVAALEQSSAARLNDSTPLKHPLLTRRLALYRPSLSRGWGAITALFSHEYFRQPRVEGMLLKNHD